MHSQANSGHWPGAATNTGQWWCPTAIYHPQRRKIILWFTAVPSTCCGAYWGVAESSDGVQFDLITLTEKGARTPPATAIGAPAPPPPAPPPRARPPPLSLSSSHPFPTLDKRRRFLGQQSVRTNGSGHTERSSHPKHNGNDYGNTIVSPNDNKDGNAVLLDNDGAGYIAYTNLAPGRWK